MKNSISFYDWCYQNLDKQEVDNIMQRWDMAKNQCSPKDISYSSHGIDGKGYYFKCLDHPEHYSELKSICNITMKHKKHLICNQCNSIGQYLIDKYGYDALKVYWSDKNIVNPFEITHGSHTEKVWLKCPDCGNEKYIKPHDFTNKGCLCPYCSDGISYPEKVILNLLKNININFIYQYNKTNANWCNRYYYDFYFKCNDTDCIIESNGLQHYKNTGNKSVFKSIKEERQNDKNKEQLAKQNGIEHYIIIDCRYSNTKWIKKNILNSELSKLFDLSHIDWIKIDKQSQRSLVKEACDLWNNGLHSTKEIGRKFKLSYTTIVKYLKCGTRLNWCNYDAKEEIKKNLRQTHINHLRQVYCIEINKTFNSIKEAGEILHIKNPSSICSCCRNKYGYKTAGGYHWMYYDEYIKQQKENS
jgi:ribosomal protein S27E